MRRRFKPSGMMNFIPGERTDHQAPKARVETQVDLWQ
jgi:hypothetical protein